MCEVVEETGLYWVLTCQAARLLVGDARIRSRAGPILAVIDNHEL